MTRLLLAPDWLIRERLRLLKSELSFADRIMRVDGPCPSPRAVQPGDGIVPFDENGIIQTDDEDDEW